MSEITRGEGGDTVTALALIHVACAVAIGALCEHARHHHRGDE